MNILHLKECPKCSRLMPYFRSTCDCGYTFTGSEHQYRTCPHCGAINPSSKIFCNCGHFVLFHHSKLTEDDIRDSYQLGVSDGVAQEKKRDEEKWSRFFEDAKLKNTITHKPITSLDDFHEWKAAYDKIKAERERLRNGPPQPAKQKETIYLMEDKDGFLVRVPESKLDAWCKAQAEPPRPLNKAEQQVIDKAVSMLYGDKSSKTDKSQESRVNDTPNDPENSAEISDRLSSADDYVASDKDEIKQLSFDIKEISYFGSIVLFVLFLVLFQQYHSIGSFPGPILSGLLLFSLIFPYLVIAILVKRGKISIKHPSIISGLSFFFAGFLWYGLYTLFLIHYSAAYRSNKTTYVIIICAITFIPAFILSVRDILKALRSKSSIQNLGLKKAVFAFIALVIATSICWFFYTHLPPALIYRIDTEEVESSVAEDERVHISLTEPYYHREGCPLLEGKSLVEVPLSYTIEKGYAPCDICYPDA